MDSPIQPSVDRVLMVCPELPSAENPGSMAPAARQIESLQELGIETEIVDMRGIPKLKYLLAIPRIRSLAKKVDLIHAHFGFCGWLARIATIGIRKPMVMSFMGDDLLGTPDDNGELEKSSLLFVNWNLRLAKRMDGVIVKSQEMADVIAPTPCTVIANGVDTDRFAPVDRSEARRRIGIPVDGHAVLFPGNPENPRKGFSLAKSAVEFAQTRLGQPVQLIPLWDVAPESVADYMNACDMMLMTSLIEGSPNVVKEALACDVPVIGVDVGDVRLMLDGIDACRCCQRDPSEIGQALAEGLVNSPHCNGRKVLLDRGLDLASVASRVRHVYHQAIPMALANSSTTIEKSAEPAKI